MKFWSNGKWRKYIRSAHRDLGYFFVGLICIYALSGIFVLTGQHGTDSAYREIITEKQLDVTLSAEELKADWSKLFPTGPTVTQIIPRKDKYLIYVKGGEGEYNPKSNLVKFKTYKERKFVKFIHAIHYNRGEHFTWLGYLLAISLLFFALSGLVMVKGKKGFKKRGVWLMLIGIIIPVIWYFL